MMKLPPAAYDHTDPVTKVDLSVHVDGFSLGVSEVTQQTYEALTHLNPSSHKGHDLPVENVSWFEAIRFANLASAQDGFAACYDLASGRRRGACKGYRLPTEAEWALAKLKTPGRVWEWCEDWFHADESPWPVDNPRGPLSGLERVIRGGSFVSSTAFSRGYRSSLDPSARSPYTGFRLARSTGERAPDPPAPVYREAPANQKGAMAPIESPAREKWLQWLGIAAEPRLSKPQARVVRQIEDPRLTGSLIELSADGGFEKVLVLYPDHDRTRHRPVVVVPYYDVDTPSGLDLGGRVAQPPGVLAFARLAVQLGYVAVAVRWFGEGSGERYDEAVANLRERHPRWTGLGRWVLDARAVLDYVETLPGVDRTRMAMMGHSLGGKLTLYAAAMDDRVKAVVVSEPGISFAFSNYSDKWYWGDRVPPGADQNELIGLIAPRPFLLIAGESADGDKSWPFLQSVLPLYGAAPERLGWINHRQGHTPTPEAVSGAMKWLRAYLGRP